MALNPRNSIISGHHDSGEKPPPSFIRLTVGYEKAADKDRGLAHNIPPAGICKGI
jgi:hypothetical protein